MVLILNKLWITKIVTTAWHLQIKSQVFITNKVIEAIPPERTSPRYKTVRKKTIWMALYFLSFLSSFLIVCGCQLETRD